jgi:hypothetical protein
MKYFNRPFLKRTQLLAVVGIFAAAISATAQKGIDSQTQKIKDDANKTTSRTTDASRSFDWGKGKTQVRERLANPYPFNGRRDTLVETISNVLKDNKMIVDEASSRLAEGIIVTQPYVFGKGQVIATNELKRYAVLAFDDTAWSRGQYALVIEVQSIDGVKNNVYVNAKVEGRAGNGLMTEWRSLESSGLAEDEFLVKLVESLTGTVVDAPQTIEP